MKKHNFFCNLKKSFLLILVFSFFYGCASKSDVLPSYQIDSKTAETKTETNNTEVSQIPSAEKSNNQNESTSQVETEYTNYDNNLISALPSIPKKTTYFEFTNPNVLYYAQMGSPKYIQMAVQSIKKTGNEYSEEDAVLLSILNAMMTTLWQSEANTVQVPAVTQELPENVYTGVISYIKSGMYDSNAGDSDFFTLILPSMVIATSSQDTFYEEAQASLTKAFDLNKDSTILNYLQGLLYSKQERFSDALPFLKQAYSSDSDCKEISLLYINAMSECKDFLPAYNIATKMLNGDGLNAQILKLCAELALNLNYLDQAESFVGRLLQQDSNNTENILLRAKILFQKQDYLKTSSLLDAYAKSNKTSLEYLLLRSALQQKWNKNSQAAITTISEALSIYPANEDALLFAAELAVETGSKIIGKSAFELIDNVAETDSNKARLLQIQISEYKREKNWQQAYTKTTELLALQETLETRLDLVNLCLELGMNSRAMEISSSLYKEKSESEDIQQVYIKSLVANKRQSEAQSLIEKLLKTASSKMKSFLYFQRSTFATTDDKKLADLRSCLTANPRNQEALFALYELYFSKNDYRKAQYYIKQAIALNQNDETLLKLNAELDNYLR